ncbi:Growth-regulating factor 5-like protein [Drosera capensis]
MSSGLSRGGGGSKFPFTPSQWQELEHQALIYKHMVAGVPIPHDLLLAVKRSLDSPLSSQNFFPAAAYQNSHMGWNPYQMGYGKRLDPEPGRCRRTDGKKWRCSKEAYPDSKYCERHMHRGKNRSRKPVEVLTTTAAAAASVTITTAEIGSTAAAAQIGVNPTTASYISSMNKNTYSSLSSFQPQLGSSDSYDLRYHHSSSSRPPGMSLSSQDTNTHLLLESGSLGDQRYLQGVKGDIGEHAFFNGARRGYTSPGSSMDEQWQLNQFKHGGTAATTSFSQQKQGYPYLELKSEAPKPEKQQTHEGYVWGRDFDCELTMRVEREIDPQKTRDSWNESSSTTQLSISMPTSSHHDFFLSNSRSP